MNSASYNSFAGLQNQAHLKWFRILRILNVLASLQSVDFRFVQILTTFSAFCNVSKINHDFS